MELAIVTINRERQRRGLPTGLTNPETIAQAEMLNSGMTVDQIFRDRISNPIYDPLIQSKVDRGLPASQIQSELAQQGLDVPLYRIQELGGQNVAPTTEVADFSGDIASMSKSPAGPLDSIIPVSKDTSFTPPTTKADIGSNRIMVKGNIYELPSNFKELLDKGILDGMQIYPILNLAYSSDPSTTMSRDIDNVLVNWAKGDEPFGKLEVPDDEFRQRLGYGKEGFLETPEDFGSFAQTAAYGAFDLGKGAIRKLVEFGKSFQGGRAVQEFKENPVFRGIDLGKDFNVQDLAEFQVQNIPGIKLVGRADRDEITEGIKDITTKYQPEANETVVVAKNLTPPEEPIDPDKIDFGVDKPTDPTKVTQEDIDDNKLADDLIDFGTQGKDAGTKDPQKLAGIIGADGKEKVITPAPGPSPSSDKLTKELETKDYGRGLARFFSSLGTQSKANNLTDALSGAAATFAATEAARSEKIRQEERDLTKELKKIIAKEKASSGDFGVTDLFKVNDAKSQINEEIGYYEGGEQAISFMNQAIELFDNAVKNGTKVTGLMGRFNRFKDEAATFFNIPIAELSDATKIDNFIEIVKQRNIKDILNESGKTISNVDRDILDRIFGGLDFTTAPQKQLEKLRASRDSLITNQRTRKRTISSINRTLNDPLLRGRGALGVENMTLLERVLAADPSNPLLQFNQTAQSINNPVFNLSGQQIN